MSEVSEPLIEPYRTSADMYLLHPEFINGLIAQIPWQCISPDTGSVVLEAGHALFQEVLFIFS